VNRLACILALLLLVGCSPEKRLARLLKKHPELMQAEVIYVRDTVDVPGAKVVEHIYCTDTVTIENERIKVEWLRIPTGSPCDTAKIRAVLSAECKEIQVPYEKRVEVKVPVIDTTKVAGWYRTFFWIVVVAAILWQSPRIIKAIKPLWLK
jgi:hypothetical protein